MAEEAEKTEIEQDEFLDTTGTLDSDETEDEAAGNDESEGGADGENPEEQDQEPEIDLTGQDTQPDDQGGGKHWVEERFQRFSRKNRELKEKLSEEQDQSRFKDEKIKLLEMALNSKKTEPEKPLELPNPDNYDGGVHDPLYQKDFQEYQRGYVQNELKRQTSEFRKKAREEATKEQTAEMLSARQKEHWRHAATLKLKDYEKAEDTFISIVGQDVFNEAVLYLDPEETTLLSYHLGKDRNRKVAESLASKIQSNPVRATVEMGRIIERIRSSAKSTNPPPPPDEELEGAGGSKHKYGPEGATYE